MRKFIITEEEKKEILKQYNLLEQDIVDTTDIGNMANTFAIKASQMSSFLSGTTESPIDPINGYVKFMMWLEDLQPTMEKMFGVKCKSSSEIENQTSIGEFGPAGKCQLIWRLITKILNWYLLSKHSPIKNDIDNKTYFSIEDVIKNNNELNQLSSLVLRGKNQEGSKYNQYVQGGVYITPNQLTQAVINVYNTQRNLLS
jgi:hypothetical protein